MPRCGERLTMAKKLKWTQQSFQLRENHGWKAKPGYKIFVAGRGAVRFDYPASWVFEPGTDSCKFRDRQPPDDDCLLQVSYLLLSPQVDWSGLPLERLLTEALKGDKRGILSRGQTVYVRRPDLELAWTEQRFFDHTQGREACSRACLARGANVQPFITMDFWPEDAHRFVPVWDEVLRTLQLGQYVKDPTKRELN
jgi:hypothetical protein